MNSKFLHRNPIKKITMDHSPWFSKLWFTKLSILYCHLCQKMIWPGNNYDVSKLVASRVDKPAKVNVDYHPSSRFFNTLSAK